MVEHWRVWFLEVWGNEEDGFEVNNRVDAGTLEIPDGSESTDLPRLLVAAGFVKTPEGLSVDWSEEDWIRVDDERGAPLFDLMHAPLH